MVFKTVLVLVLVAGVILIAERASAQMYLLVVDDTNPAAVTITATLNDPSAADSSHYFIDGIDLKQFFKTAPGPTQPSLPVLSSTLTPSLNITPFYNSADTDNLSGTFVDFNLYTSQSTPGYNTTQTFSTIAPGFIGMATVNMSGVATILPPPGTSGDVYAGIDFDFTTTLIGSYTVIPEASSGIYVVFGILSLAWIRHLTWKCSFSLLATAG